MSWLDLGAVSIVLMMMMKDHDVRVRTTKVKGCACLKLQFLHVEKMEAEQMNILHQVKQAAYLIFVTGATGIPV